MASLRASFAQAAETVGGVHGEGAIGPRHALHAVVLAHVEPVIGRHLAVVFQRLAARGLGIGTGERNSPISSSSEVVKNVMCAG